MKITRALGTIDKKLYYSGIRSLSKLSLPDFLGIGFPKAGTTWLYENLHRHPQVYMSVPKELNYFGDDHFGQPLRTYADKFREGKGKICGEISPGYAYLPPSRIRDIRRILPEARLIMMLRNTIEQQWSHAVHDLAYRKNRAIEAVPFQEWRERFQGAAMYQAGGCAAIIDKWLTHFPPDQVLVDFYEEIAEHPVDLLKRVFTHIGASCDIDWESLPYAEVIVPPSRFKDEDRGRGIVAADHVNTSRLMPEPVWDLLTGMYRADLEELQRRYGDRISKWFSR